MIARKYTILVIDDSPEDRAVYDRYLGKSKLAEYHLVEAESGDEGLEQLESWRPDLILLDYLLPDCNGLEFIIQLKQIIALVPPIIMLTGQGDETVAVEAMKKGVQDYLVKGKLTPEILNNSVRNVIQQYSLQSLLRKSLQQQQLIAETALRIRQSVNLADILNTAVNEVRALLNCDRVVIYRFAPDMSGDIVAESVKPEWTRSFGLNIIDTCFQQNGTARYQKGESLVINNTYESGLSPCHIKLLEQFEVKAHIVCSLLLSPSPSSDKTFLWGLLIAHQCDDYRNWETDEVKLLDKLAVQLGIAIQQAELVDSLKTELNTGSELRQELARLVRVLEASEDYIGLATPQGKVIWSNPRMLQAVGLDENSVSESSISDYHPDWATNIVKKEAIPAAINRGTWLGETALLTIDGHEIPVSQMIIAHKSAAGNIEYISTVMRDLSPQKQAEESLREKAQELEWLNQELLKTASLLKKRNQELDRFAYVTSHDLKAPLRAIANLANWLSEDLAGQIPEENQTQLELMQSRVQRMDGLIQGLLTYSRVGRNRNPATVVDVGKIVNNAIDSISPPPEFKIAIATELPTLNTQALMLEQVFTNLISNAIKYHDRPEGTITISAIDKGNFYQFAVADDGIGIEPQYHERIFKIFQTLQARDTIESTGIGLSIVKKIVEDMGGEVSLKSELDKGSTFYFTWKK